MLTLKGNGEINADLVAAQRASRVGERRRIKGGFDVFHTQQSQRASTTAVALALALANRLVEVVAGTFQHLTSGAEPGTSWFRLIRPVDANGEANE